MAGAEIGANANYGYLGLVQPLEHGPCGGGRPAVRYWLDWLRYQYEDKDNNRTVTAVAPGGEAAFGCGYDVTHGQVAAWAGLTLRDTSLSPSAASSRVEGLHGSLKLQGEADLKFTVWRSATIVAYLPGTESYWLRQRFLHPLGENEAGVEAIAEGDPEYDAQRLGVVFAPSHRPSQPGMLFKAGVRRSPGTPDTGYVGVELVFAGQ